MSDFHRVYAFALILSLGISLALPSRSTSQSTPQPLPPQVNLPDVGEVLPVISADGRSLYFTRPRTGLDGSQVLDIWRSRIHEDGSFDLAEPLGGNLYSRFGIAVISVSPDNNTLHLAGRFDEFALPDERLFVTHRTKEGWEIPKLVHIDSLRPNTNVTDFSFGPDQQSLLIAVDRDSTLGGSDLYVSFLKNDSGATENWSKPRWLGPVVNSRFSEITPFLAGDNRTLYFASDRPGGYGELDVYRATRLDNSWRSWTAPENVGPSINRPGRTAFYTEDAQRKFAYFTWRHDINSPTDIYRVRPDHADRKPLILLSGRSLDDSGHVIHEATITYSNRAEGRELGRARTDPATGSYQIVLTAGALYDITAYADGYMPGSDTADLRSLVIFGEKKKDVILHPVRKGASIRLRTILFALDRADLLPESRTELDRIVQLMRRSTTTFRIEGHTDSLGSESHNQQLSQARAESVMKYLIKQGVNPTRLTAEGYGGRKPIASNSTEEGRAENRRVQITVVQ